MIGEFPAQRASNAENVSIWWRHHEFIPCPALIIPSDWMINMRGRHVLRLTSSARCISRLTSPITMVIATASRLLWCSDMTEWDQYALLMKSSTYLFMVEYQHTVCDIELFEHCLTDNTWFDFNRYCAIFVFAPTRRDTWWCHVNCWHLTLCLTSQWRAVIDRWCLILPQRDANEFKTTISIRS